MPVGNSSFSVRVVAKDANGLGVCFAASWMAALHWGLYFFFFSLWEKRGFDRSWRLISTWSLLENVYSEEGAVFEPTMPSLSCLAQ